MPSARTAALDGAAVRLEREHDQRGDRHGVRSEGQEDVVVGVALMRRTGVQTEADPVADMMQDEAQVSDLEAEVGAHRVVVVAGGRAQPNRDPLGDPRCSKAQAEREQRRYADRPHRIRKQLPEHNCDRGHDCEGLERTRRTRRATGQQAEESAESDRCAGDDDAD